MSKQQARLKAALQKKLLNYRNPYHMAVENGDSHGLIYRCLNGGFSPTLYKKYIKPEPRKRTRFTADVGPDLVALFDDLCAAEETTRPVLLAWMVRNHVEYHGRGDYAELPY